MAKVQDGQTNACGSPDMLEESQDGMDNGALSPPSARQVTVKRHPLQGFGFIAGSQRPVIVRSVSADGPSFGKLLPGDQILAINEETVSDAPRERVIDLVRRCKDTIVLTVLQPHQSPKSAFISAAKKARLRTNPPKVRFSEQVSISDPDSTMLKDDSLLLIPNVLKVFLENGQIKSFTFDSRTTVRDVISSLQDRLSLRYIEHFALVLEAVKEKNVCKTLSQLLKTYQHPPPTGNKVPPLQGKLQYMRVLNDLPPFGGILFQTVGLDEKQSASTLLVGPRHGISHVIDLKNNLTTVLAEFSRVSKIQLYRESQGVARVEVSIHEAKPLVLLMEWPDASNFACLISGYYKLFVDPKRTIYVRSFGQSQLTKPDYRSSHHPHPRSGATGLQSGGRRMEERECSHRESGNSRALVPAEPQHLGLCHVHLREHQQLQEHHVHTEAELDINENFISQEPSGRPRTKSDPTQESTEEIAVVLESPAVKNTSSRVRAQTMGQSKRGSRYFCDSCKARLRAEGLSTIANSSGSSGKHCSSACASRDGGAVDLTALPPPGNEEEDEEEANGKEETLQPPPPAIAAPPPGFRDNSSDEDDPKRGRKALTSAAPGVASVKQPQPKEDVPVTLIDNVTTRTVRDHAQELDDALVSTLQALEALAASEDYPHHPQQPTQTAGLIVLAAITPESSLDSGHETNSSELTDVSEMVSAMKQNQNQTYLLAHHINKERILCRRDFPLAIPGCTAKTIGTGAFSVGQIRAGCPPKQVILSKTVPFKVSHPSPDSAILSVVTEQGNNQGTAQTESKAELKAISESAKANNLDPSVKPAEELKVSDASLSVQVSTDQNLSNCSGEMQSLNLPDGVKVKTAAPLHADTISKALPKILPVDTVVSAKISLTNMCQNAKTASSETMKPSSFTEILPVDDLFCTCPVQKEPETQLKLKDPQLQKIVVFQSSSPTDDERLRAKGLQLANGKENAARPVTDQNLAKPSPQIQAKFSPHLPAKFERKETSENKSESTQGKSLHDSQKCPVISLPILDDLTTPSPSVEKVSTLPAIDSKKQGNGKGKSQRSAPFLSFRNLLSATFPARMRRETDERRAQLQKVRQYELEFLEELLKPKSSQGEFLPQGSSPVPSGTPCACQLRTSPVLKAPGISREQRRSCDCKRMCRGMRLPDTPVGSTTETKTRGRERTISKTPPVASKVPHAEGATRRPQTLEIKTTRIRSTSLESREPRGEQNSCLPTCTSETDCMGGPQYKKLQRRYSIGELDNSTSTPVYAEVKPKTKSLEKEMEKVRATGLRLPTPIEPVHTRSHQAEGKGKKGVLFIQGEELLRESKEGPGEVLLTLPSEDSDDKDKCCSFCFCYRKCEAADESSEKDELSYSIPLQVLPGMEMDSRSFPVVSKTLQVLNAEDCSGEEEEEEEDKVIDADDGEEEEGNTSRCLTESAAEEPNREAAPDGEQKAEVIRQNDTAAEEKTGKENKAANGKRDGNGNSLSGSNMKVSFFRRLSSTRFKQTEDMEVDQSVLEEEPPSPAAVKSSGPRRPRSGACSLL
uniref:FERM and PDZ domain containing 3 n=1 Tax=Nothobranchius rachovii TaxID=451742 RepID=A0A1A8SBZ8_9TELE